MYDVNVPDSCPGSRLSGFQPSTLTSSVPHTLPFADLGGQRGKEKYISQEKKTCHCKERVIASHRIQDWIMVCNRSVA